MKLGLCCGFENAAIAAKAGFDYMEAPLNAVAALPQGAFDALLASPPPLPVFKCNCFLPGALRVTGDGVSYDDLRAYLSVALSRARQLGVEIVVFGSGASRAVPQGFPVDAAWRQVRDFLSLAAEYAEQNGLTIALEPLRRAETNLMNLVSEAAVLAALIDHPRVGVLGDTFHMLTEREPLGALARAGAAVKHLHISRALPDLSGRVFPVSEGGDDAALLTLLSDMGYAGDISIEASTTDLHRDAPLAAAYLKPLIAAVSAASKA